MKAFIVLLTRAAWLMTLAFCLGIIWVSCARAAPINYSPSASAACTNNWHGNTVCLDVFLVSTQVGTSIVYAVMQKQPNGQWDWLGNAPINGVQPGGQWIYKSEMWSFDTTSSSVPYRAPDGTVYTQYNALGLMNQFQGALVTGWMPTINAFLDGLWASVGGTPPPSGPPFTDVATGGAWLQNLLASYQFDTNGHVSPK